MQSMDSPNPPALSLSDAWLKQAAEAMRQIADALAALAQAAKDYLLEVWRPFQQAMADYYLQRVAPYLADLAAIVAEWREAQTTVAAIEQARRDFAAWYNARHKSKRVSWRRLSGPQRVEAALMFLELPIT